MEKKERLSDFLCVLRRDGLVAVFHQLNPEPFYFLEEKWEEVASTFNHPFSSLLREKNLLCSKKADQEILQKTRDKALNILSSPQILYLLMTNGCNYSCSYCPITIRKKRQKNLSYNDAVLGIQLWKKHILSYPQSDTPYTIIFYGGEPLLSWKTIKDLLSFILKERKSGNFPKNLSIMLCTNGSLIDENIAKTLAKYNVSVSLGADDIECKGGVIKNYLSFLETTETLRRRKIPIFASLTITPDNLSHLKDYATFFEDVGILKFGLNLMKGRAVVERMGRNNIEAYAKSCAEAISSKRNGCKEYQIEKKEEIFQKGLPFSTDCTCYGNQLVIYPDGKVGNCPFLPISQGYVSKKERNFLIAETRTVKEWRKRIPLFNDSLLVKEKNCILDGGGCAWNSAEVFGGVSARDESNSIFTKEVCHEIIWNFIPKMEREDILRRNIHYWNYRRIRDL